MVQWFSPGFLACTQWFETHLMLASFWVLAWAGEYYDLSCAAGLVLSGALNLVFLNHDLSSNVKFEIIQYVVFTIECKLYKFLRRIHAIVDAHKIKRECEPNYLESC